MRPELYAVEKTAPRIHSETVNNIERRKSILDKELEHSLELEAAMYQLQLEFRSHSRSLSEHLDQLGKLLRIKQTA